MHLILLLNTLALCATPHKQFATLNLTPHLNQRLQQLGYRKPMPIQTQAMEQIAKGQSVVIHSQTGSGKTLAFMLPIIATMPETKTDIDAIIVAPSQELAIQLASEAQLLIEKADDVLLAISGVGENDQLRRLACAKLIVGTPSRLVKLLTPIRKRLSRVRVIVLDEVDALLPVGSMPEISSTTKISRLDSKPGSQGRRQIGKRIRTDSRSGFRGRSGWDESIERRLSAKRPAHRLLELMMRCRARDAAPLQVVSASATVDAPIRRGLGLILGGHGKGAAGKVITANPLRPPSSNLRQRGIGNVAVPTTLTHSAYIGNEKARLSLLRVALQELVPDAPLLVLPNGESIPSQVAELRKAGFQTAVALHEAFGVASVSSDSTRTSGLPECKDNVEQTELVKARDSIAHAFAQRFAPPLLVTTEQGARGVDLKGVDCVLLLGLPKRCDAYVHVTGRTAREGKRGKAVCILFSDQDLSRLQEFRKELGIRIEVTDLRFLKE